MMMETSLTVMDVRLYVKLKYSGIVTEEVKQHLIRVSIQLKLRDFSNAKILLCSFLILVKNN